MPHSDLELVRGALRGDAPARVELAARLLAAHGTLAARNAKLGRPLDRADIEDLLQEVAILVWSKLADYEGRCSFDGWVHRFCMIGLLAFRRRLRRLPARLEAVAKRAAVLEPERDSWQHERVTACLDDLDGSTREIIRLKHYEDRTFDEIAVRLRISSNTIKTRYYRGLARLRRRIRMPRHSAELEPCRTR